MTSRLARIGIFVWIAALAVLGSIASHADDGDALFDALKAAPSEEEARQIENRIWNFWLDSAPDSETQQLVDKGMSCRNLYDLAGAREFLDQAIERSPGYAEAWNQRAFVLFLQGELDASLEDADRAIELEPRHFGALSGKALILLQQGRTALSQNALRKAVEIHPYLKERHLLIKPKGQDL
jgi:tetratricopeptide (TPR) repeat protein